jgi:hypothetical protein
MFMTLFCSTEYSQRDKYVPKFKSLLPLPWSSAGPTPTCASSFVYLCTSSAGSVCTTRAHTEVITCFPTSYAPVSPRLDLYLLLRN